MIGMILEDLSEKRALRRGLAPLFRARQGRHARAGRYAYTGYRA